MCGTNNCAGSSDNKNGIVVPNFEPRFEARPSTSLDGGWCVHILWDSEKPDIITGFSTQYEAIEIDEERYALKALRGDFKSVSRRHVTTKSRPTFKRKLAKTAKRSTAA
jgi:hypothetical protein